MAKQTLSANLTIRLNTLKSITDRSIKTKLTKVFTDANGDWAETMKKLKETNVDEKEIAKLDFAHSLADLTTDNQKLVSTIVTLPNITSMRDLALNYNAKTLAEKITPEMVPADVEGDTPEVKVNNYASTLQNKVFNIETSAVLQRMSDSGELPITDATIRNGITTFFANQPEFNIRTTSVYNAINNQNAFKNISEESKDGVINQLKVLQRIQAISPTPSAVTNLMEAKIQTAYQVSEMTPKDFVKAFSGKMTEQDAMIIHTNATNARIQYEHTLMTMHEFLNEPHIAAIDRSPAKSEKLSMVQKKTDELQIPVNWENLFGNVDFCECGECNSVYSPASYFVELLQYLRNNNTDPSKIKTDLKDISGTPLEMLFRRRPDLGCLELSCENTNTVLPYIDLVNEVMESFVVHFNEYHADPNDPKQAKIEPWNVKDETTGELLAQPQHINYNAYCILKKAVYPFTLPYHQPIDAIRIFLKYLETSRYELMKTFRSSGVAVNKNEELPEGSTMPAAAPDPDLNELNALNNVALDRAIDAEYLNITQEEFIILTKEAFWQKRYFEIKCKKNFTEDEYRNKIGVKNTYEYYGYANEADMLSTDENATKGLTFVKPQFLKRTGLLYVDLVELLKTQFINPNFLQGKALTVLESIRFSYRFLQTLVDSSSNDPKIRFSKLVDFLQKTQPFLPLVDALLHPDPCKPTKVMDSCTETSDLKKWIYCYFERIGKLIVLESGDEPTLPIEGDIVKVDPNKKVTKVGSLKKDGTIYDINNKLIGKITPDVKVVDLQNKPFNTTVIFGTNEVYIIDSKGDQIGFIIGEMLFGKSRSDKISWQPAKDTCNLDKVRLKHLDGTDLTSDEYDKIQRFIRLWRKLGWTIDETDKALTGLACYSLGQDAELPSDDNCQDCFDETSDDCNSGNAGDDWKCLPDITKKVYYDITPDFLHQLVAVKKLLDLTGLELIKLLTFWTNISTVGEKSLYIRLFLTHNLISIDKVFKPDKNGSYLTQTEKITDHIPVVMAAFNLKAEDILTIMDFKQIKDELTIQNISIIYRHSLLMRILHVKCDELKEIIALFKDPFTDAHTTYKFLKLWGRMEDSGFTFRQLNYIIRNIDAVNKPLTPKKKFILQLAKTLYDGLNQIDKDHPDLDKVDAETISQLQKDPPLTDEEKNDLLKDKATDDLVRSKVSLLFDQNTVSSIIDLLAGATMYSTNAPKNLVSKVDDFTSKLSDTLKKKIKYDFTNGGMQVTGILTGKEVTDAKALFNPPEWSAAIDRVGKKALYYFNDVLTGIFSDNVEEAKQILLQGDINIPEDQQDPNNPLINTPPVKRKYFLEKFLPFLREQLTHRFLVDNLSSAAELEKKVTDVLISDILEETTPNGKEKIIEIFKGIKTLPPAGSTGWKGYLIPTNDDDYTFAVVSDNSPSIKIDGESLEFIRQDDPTNLWLSKPEKLLNGRTYLFEAEGLSSDLNELSWKTPTSPKAAIPASVLLPDYSAQSVEDSFIELQKAAIIVSGFELNDEEVSYLQDHGSDFNNCDFNAISLDAWKRFDAFTRLRNSLPETDTNLLEFFNWANQALDASKLSEKISSLTLWKKEDVDKLIEDGHFGINQLDDFRNEKNLLKLQKAIYVAGKINMDIDLLFDWAKPTTKFWICHKIAESIRKSIRARYKQEDWEQVVEPLNDELRGDQRDALISYLLVQQDLIDWGVVDADSLFEFFLIDVQMDACMETSRIKQAISSVQLYVQRCFLGLEDKYGVASYVLDRDRWSWMSRDVIWQANRKVFLYPENWIEEDLRDDKSPFYKELESELLQKDINKQNVTDALKSYLYKVDEVSNMQVVGIFVDNDNQKVHIFSRTRNTPYFFYYRNYKIDEKNWLPWEKLQVDIPNYDIEDKTTNEIIGNGCYLIPAVLNNRLLIFFPQIVKKTFPSTLPANVDPNNSIPVSAPVEKWEIKMGWSEYRNGKWTQKQISKDAVYQKQPNDSIDNYKFIPIINQVNNNIIIGIEDSVDNDKGVLDSFQFEGSKIFKRGIIGEQILPSSMNPTFGTKFSFNKIVISSNHLSSRTWQVTGSAWGNTIYSTDETEQTITENIDGSSIPFYHSDSHFLLGEINQEDLTSFFNRNLDLTNIDNSFGFDSNKYDELRRPYSIYNWELFFHTPMTLANYLSKSQQFEEAIKWYHFVFNPYANGLDVNRAWQFYPFLHTNADNFLESFFAGLQPNTPDDEINKWRDNPFNPHLIARTRPSAYMKWTVMKYIDNLIAWGDYLFRQDTIESINYATQLYILAYHILGPKPQMIPKRGKIRPQTYNSLLDKWDAFGNAMVELELVFPFSNQTSFPIGVSNGVVGLANIFGFVSSLYFCIPNNPTLLGYWDTIADRLYKIRHCENIEGIFRKLALWDPPIDPALLVQAVAQGISIDSVLNDLNTPMPNYRFNYLVQKAVELCNELKSMGNSLLSIFEKKDSEVLSKLRAGHETSIQNLIMEIKKMQLDESNKSLEGLEQNRKTPVYRLQHYLKLIGEDLNKVPTEDADYAEINEQIEKPIDESGLKLIAYEKEEIDKANAAADWQIAIGIVETLASIFHALPTIHADGHPLGVGADVVWGFPNLANAVSAVGRGLQTYASNLSYQSSSAQRKGGFLRQLQDRVLQANLAGYEIKQIDKQIVSQKIRINIAEQEITNQQKQIDNAVEIEEFLKNKYTNEELYTWMEGSIKTLYHQVYTLAYDLAKKAEKVFRFERGLSVSNFIQYGYWDASHDGLQAGERLYVGIKQLEAAYQEKRGYDFEITKHISLQQLNPLALIQIRGTGKCEFEFPEVLFDMDFPGHYMRRIKSAAISIPCIAGPYTSINSTLRLQENKFRISSLAKDKNDYPEKIEETDERFTTVNIPITSIATSMAQNDSGVFELNFRDERYMPFEGAGAISKWSLDLPTDFRQFDYETISDIIIHLRYTSIDGGDKLKKAAGDYLMNYIKTVEELSQQQGLFVFFDLKHEFANEWYKALQLPPDDNGRIMQLGNLTDRLPIFTKTFDPKKIKAKDISIAASSSVKNSDLTLMYKDTELDQLGGAIKISGTLNLFHLSEQDETMEDWSLKFSNDLTEPEKMWMVVRYTLST